MKEKVENFLEVLAKSNGGLVEGVREAHRTSNIEHRTSNIEHRTSNIEHRTSNIEPKKVEASGGRAHLSGRDRFAFGYARLRYAIFSVLFFKRPPRSERSARMVRVWNAVTV